ncbi:ribonuclease Oy isoform X2 [Diachasma alloeum]|uniref:ribonuclease Oy isoform X2 n=1 Tax=Diachasma alloeum TaxID=454923 RepID=UPI000738118D|nr:ribonuclease Oy isoform X2 [Diachasma alloeum]
MGVIKNLWLLFLLGIIGSVQTYPQSQAAIPRQSIYFDHFVFSQVWPPTLCPAPKQETTDSCNQTVRNHWMIHGLWPGKFHTLDVKYCDNSSIFDPTSIDSIKTEMEMKWLEWMPVDDDDKPLPVWKHEWEKHGTCSTSLEILKTQEMYFKKALELYDSHNMNNVLENANIRPGNYYSVGAILSGVSRVLGKRCMLHCSTKPGKNESHLEELWICFDKSLNLIHCDEVLNFPTDCPWERDVYYPEYPPNDYKVQVI